MFDFQAIVEQVQFYAKALDGVILFGAGLAGVITMFVQWFKYTSFIKWLKTKIALPDAWPRYFAVTLGTLIGSLYLIYGSEFGLPTDVINYVVRIIGAWLWSFGSSVFYDLLKATSTSGVEEHVENVEKEAVLDAGNPEYPTEPIVK